MGRFLTVVTSMVMTLNLLTACGSSAASAEITTAAASEAASEKKTTGREAEGSEPAAGTAGADSIRFQSSTLFRGSTSLYPILSSLASSFTEKYAAQGAVDSSFPDSNISVYVTPGSSGVEVSAAIDGTADFSILAGDIKDSEIEALGEHYRELVVAKDTLTMSANAENPIYGITDDIPAEAVHQIFAGEVATQDQVDSTLPAEATNVHIRSLPGGVYGVFQKNVMGNSEATASATQSASMTELTTNIAGDKRGTGYVEFGIYNKANVDEQVLTTTKVDGVEATVENIINGAYTIQGPVMFVIGARITPSKRAFIDYIFSQTGYNVVETNGYIPVFAPEA